MHEYRNNDDPDEPLYTRAIKAGRRTYFFDVKSTLGGDYFITITESRKRSNPDGTASFDRRTIFLYKEDFSKFQDGFDDVLGFIKHHKPELFGIPGSTTVDDEEDYNRI